MGSWPTLSAAADSVSDIPHPPPIALRESWHYHAITRRAPPITFVYLQALTGNFRIVRQQVEPTYVHFPTYVKARPLEYTEFPDNILCLWSKLLPCRVFITPKHAIRPTFGAAMVEHGREPRLTVLKEPVIGVMFDKHATTASTWMKTAQHHSDSYWIPNRLATAFSSVLTSLRDLSSIG